jgi:phage tail sheath gpL-like
MSNNRTPQALGLRELNNPTPGVLSSVLAAITCAAFGASATVPFGDLVNKLIAQGNQGSSSTAAARTATVAGTVAAGDVLTLTIGGVAFPHTIVDGTDATSAATEYKNSLNADATFSAAYTASNAAGVITITAKRKGTGGNAITFAAAKTGSGGTTFTAAGATLTGATGVDDLLAIV